MTSLPGTPPPNQDGSEHMDSTAASSTIEQQFQQLQWQVQELLDREMTKDRLLSATQQTQVQSIVQGSLKEAIEKAASAAAQAAVSTFHGWSAQASESSTQVTASPESERPEISPPRALSTPAIADAAVPQMLSFPAVSADTAMDSVHEVPAKPVKEIISGEFMELSKLLPKNFNTLNPLHDGPLTLTVENSVIKVNKAKVSSITDIAEWSTAFTAYMGVLISKFQPHAPEFLEYMSLIRYAAKHHKGLGWCVYDVKFRQKATTNKSLKWSTIDSQLWLKTFMVAPSLLKEDLGVFQSGPSTTITSRGTEIRTCHNYNRGVPCARTPCIYAHKCNRSGAGRIIPGLSAPISMEEQKKSLFQGWESHSPSTRAPATEKRSFGGVVTPVNIVNLYQALSNHPEREFVNKLCSELREGARIGYSGPRCPRFSNNLPTAYLNPDVVTANLADEVSKGHTMGPFPTPPFKN